MPDDPTTDVPTITASLRQSSGSSASGRLRKVRPARALCPCGAWNGLSKSISVNLLRAGPSVHGANLSCLGVLTAAVVRPHILG